MTELEYVIEESKIGAMTFLKYYGQPSWAEIEDVFSQAKVVALLFLNSQRYDPDRVRTRVICGLIDWARHENSITRPLLRDQEPETVEWDNPEPEEEQRLANKEIVAKMLEWLDVESRELVEEVFFRGVNQKEIAERWGLSQPAICWKLTTIKSALREKFGEICGY